MHFKRLLCPTLSGEGPCIQGSLRQALYSLKICVNRFKGAVKHFLKFCMKFIFGILAI